MIPNPDLKDTPLFDVQYLINGIHDRDIVTMQDTNKKFIFITHPLHCRKKRHCHHTSNFCFLYEMLKRIG